MRRTLSALVVLALASVASAQPATFNWSIPAGGLQIPDATPAGVFVDLVVGQNIDFTQSAGNCVEVTLQFGGPGVPGGGHTWIGDLTATLSKVGDGSQTLFSRPGMTASGGFGSSSDAQGPYTFTNKTTNQLWNNLGGGGTFLVPAGSYNASAPLTGAALDLCAPFLASGSVGTWRLTVSDSAGGDTGSIVSASLTLKPEPSSLALLGLGALALIRRRR